MLCRRSASFTSSTRMSDDIASTSLRRFSASLVLSDWTSRRLSLVTPSTRRATFSPNRRAISSRVASVSSSVSCNRRVTIDGVGEIGGARGAQLGAVLLQPVDIGAVQHLLVRIGIVGLHALDEFKLTNHDNRPLYGDDCAHSTLFM